MVVIRENLPTPKGRVNQFIALHARAEEDTRHSEQLQEARRQLDEAKHMATVREEEYTCVVTELQETRPVISSTRNWPLRKRRRGRVGEQAVSIWLNRMSSLLLKKRS